MLPLTQWSPLRRRGIRRRLCVPNAAKPRSPIFTKIRKVLLSYLREAKPSNPTQQKPTTQTPPMPTHRKVRSAIPTRFLLRLPSPCSRALSEVERMRNEATRRGDHPKTSLFAEAFSPRREKAGVRFAPANPSPRPRRGQKQTVRTARLCRP